MKNRQKFPIIETTRLKLRRPLQKDAIALLEATQDETVMKYYRLPLHGVLHFQAFSTLEHTVPPQSCSQTEVMPVSG